MTEMNLFEYATRNKIRFESVAGFITVEDLWDLKLTNGRSNMNLDSVAKSIARKLREMDEESFVEKSVNTGKRLLEIQLEIVKHIINVKITEAEEASKRLVRAQERKRLLIALDKKQEEKIDSMSEEDIEKRLKELS